MQIRNDYTVNYPKFNNKNNDNTSFQGIPARAIFREVFPKNQDKLWEDCSDIAQKLDMSTRSIKFILEIVSDKRFNFMNHLTDYYNARNCFLKGNLRENPQDIIDIFKSVEKVTPEHDALLNSSDMPVKTLKELFSAANDKESLNFSSYIQKEVMDGTNASALKIIDMLNSPNRNNYIRDFSNYISYIKLNFGDENVIKNLDKLIASGSYQAKTYDAKLAVKEFLNRSNIKDGIAPFAEELEKNYSKAGKNFMEKFSDSFLAYRKGLSEKDYRHIVDMYSSTTDKNVRLRTALVDKFKYSDTTGYSKISDIEELKILFDRIDGNENITTFIKKALEDKIDVKTIKEMNDILDTVPPKKAEIFHKNIANIVRYTTEREERITALENEIENPFFITPQFKRQRDEAVKAGINTPESKWQTLMIKLENEYNIRKYRHYLKTHEDVINSVEKNREEIPNVLPNPVEKIVSPVSEPKSEINSSLLPIKFVKHPKELPAIKKLRVKLGVSDIIEQKLGAKTLASQRANYMESANVMRLKLLPEIFQSIKETRRQQKISGMKSRIDTREALKLYEKITGKNRKLIRYMLKQTNSDNERLFTIRDINATISKAEAEILKNKKANPKYKAADAKALYEDIFQTMVEKYGKLRRVKKQS